MKKEDIEFLRELQHELNTQEHDEQASPRYWGIAETRVTPAPDFCGDPIIYVGDGAVMTCKEFTNFINDGKYYEGNEDEWAEVDKTNMDELVAFANCILLWSDVRIVYQQTEHDIISHSSNVFLTKRACKKHIETNGYHYSKPHTYAMTAWRNPEFERVLKILQTMNIDDIKITED